MEKVPVNSYIENYSKMSECPLKIATLWQVRQSLRGKKKKRNKKLHATLSQVPGNNYNLKIDHTEKCNQKMVTR